MDNREIQRRLNDNGFPCGPVDGVMGSATRDAVSRFQVAYCGPGGWLEIDGKAGPATQRALEFLPYLSTNFTWRELACHHCNRAYVNRQMLSALEELRTQWRRPIRLLCAYRCPDHNHELKSNDTSMHVHGAAFDLETAIPADFARKVKRFSGIGTRGSLASHLDVRHLMGKYNQTPHATVGTPATWRY